VSSSHSLRDTARNLKVASRNLYLSVDLSSDRKRRPELRRYGTSNSVVIWLRKVSARSRQTTRRKKLKYPLACIPLLATNPEDGLARRRPRKRRRVSRLNRRYARRVLPPKLSYFSPGLQLRFANRIVRVSRSRQPLQFPRDLTTSSSLATSLRYTALTCEDEGKSQLGRRFRS
jgi:hypothetical protein